MLSDILERLAEKIFSYKAYPKDADLSDVAEALTRKYPCLRQPDSFNESYGWKLRLKSKMFNYRTQLKSHGHASELNAEVLHVTAVPLLIRFMAELDKYSLQLLQIIRKKGGTTKAKTATILPQAS